MSLCVCQEGLSSQDLVVFAQKVEFKVVKSYLKILLYMKALQVQCRALIYHLAEICKLFRCFGVFEDKKKI